MDSKAVVTYDFNGVKHVRNGHSFRVITGDEFEIFQQLEELERQQNWPALRDLCEAQIEKTPEWLTPYLCAGVAHANLGASEPAIRRLEYVEQRADGNALYSAAARILGQLRRDAAGPAAAGERVN